MSRDVVTVFAPATVANLGPGYDVLGLALEAPGDRVLARRTARPGVTLTAVRGEGELPPAGPGNTAAVAARAVLELLGRPFGVELELEKGLALGSGLGSSGASAAAAAVAVNLLADHPLALARLVPPCAEAEAAACGAAHADNVAPALLGGITLVRAADDVTRLQTALELWVALVSPRQRLDTARARQAIPARVPLAQAVHNGAHLASLVYGLTVGDPQLVRRSLSDRIAEPRRAPLIPGFTAAKEAALAAGALGASISGAGPAIFALCQDRVHAQQAMHAMSHALASLGPPPEGRISRVGVSGAREVRP